MVDRALNLLKHLLAGSVMAALNIAAIILVAMMVARFIDTGAIDDDTGLIALGLFSGVAVSVITAVGYERLKLMFGLTSWQKNVDAKLDLIIEQNKQILRGQEEIINLLRTYLPAIAASLAALAGTPVPPPPPASQPAPPAPAPPQNDSQEATQASSG